MPEAPGGHIDARRVEIAVALDRTRRRIVAACAEVTRDPGEVTLVAVTKTYPASDVRHLLALGVYDIGENRDSEASVKAAEVGPGPRWHFVGQLQRNKCRSVVGYATMVHSVDRASLALTLAEAVAQEERAPLDVLLQVSLDGDPSRGGVPPTDLHRLADVVIDRPELTLRGLMAVAPLGWEPVRAFDHLAQVYGDFGIGYPTVDVLSAGMSGDLTEAIRAGATHVRVGSALLGRQPAAGLA
ncbi:MAG: YggS family pyridoxal phosphate-dependent enzyme [Longispora sp.]|nr:YggS family pyridoxal phosphate-dependent enzyme [Longispora sp. (in: high G+C Gram-positive bacteria)]